MLDYSYKSDEAEKNIMSVRNQCYMNKEDYLFHEGGPYHIETSPLICRANQWTGFYIIGTSVLKQLIASLKSFLNLCSRELMKQKNSLIKQFNTN